jgi:Arc/MetJ-type ribon-helix-helix transcriptional regulator
MRTTKSVTISLPPKQLKTAERLAKKQNRTMSELFREGLRRLEQEEQGWQPSPGALRDLGNVIRLIQMDAKRAGLDKMTKREINAEVEAARKEMRATARRSTNRSGK